MKYYITRNYPYDQYLEIAQVYDKSPAKSDNIYLQGGEIVYFETKGEALDFLHKNFKQEHILPHLRLYNPAIENMKLVKSRHEQMKESFMSLFEFSAVDKSGMDEIQKSLQEFYKTLYGMSSEVAKKRMENEIQRLFTLTQVPYSYEVIKSWDEKRRPSLAWILYPIGTDVSIQYGDTFKGFS